MDTEYFNVSEPLKMSRNDELRLMAKVARMYYVQSIGQTVIKERLNIHQSTVSRLFKEST